MVTRKKSKDKYRKQAREQMDNRPWFDRATDRQFWTPDEGSHTVFITGDVTERQNEWGNQIIDVPTSQGVLSTGSFSVMRPLAVAYKKRKKLEGLRLLFTVHGDRQARRFENVQVMDGKTAIA